MKCSYGCGTDAVHEFKNGKFCCSEKACNCPLVRQKSANKNTGTKQKLSKKICPLCHKEVGANTFNKHFKFCERSNHTCQSCNKEFISYSKDAKFCSQSCYHKYLKSEEGSKECSYRMLESYASGVSKPYGGNIKRQDYINHSGETITVIGSYEVRACKILDSWIEKGSLVEWIYTPGGFEYFDESDNKHTYFPDFKLIFNDSHVEFLEVKGFKRDLDEFKWSYFRTYHKQILNVWYNSDLLSYE